MMNKGRTKLKKDGGGIYLLAAIYIYIYGYIYLYIAIYLYGVCT